jgi:very-short-patch-repair endonuclease
LTKSSSRREIRARCECIEELTLPSPLWGRGEGGEGVSIPEVEADTDRRRPHSKRTSRSIARGPKQISRARESRQSATKAEDLAWDLLRQLRKNGFLFRRQQPAGHYIVDFCCLKERLIIELDGSAHAQPSQEVRDAKRDERLRDMGYRVARFSNGMVLSAQEEFVKRVLRLLRNAR